MRKLQIPLVMLTFCFLSLISCKKETVKSPEEIESKDTFESNQIASFFGKHPKLASFKTQVEKLYEKHAHHYLWYDRSGINEVGELLYSKINNLDDEGVPNTVPYRVEFNTAVEDAEKHSKPDAETELLFSAMYFYYADKVLHGIDPEQSKELGWYLPRKKMSYVNYLDSLLIRPSLINKDEKEIMGQYYRLREVLQRYRDIQKKGGWKTVVFNSKNSPKVGDSSPAIAQMRERLAITGDLKSDSKSTVFDKELADGIIAFKTRMGDDHPTDKITPNFIKDINVSVGDRIKTIIVNMERCRWISTDLTKADEYIVINIPSYRLTYFRDKQIALTMGVVVGKELNKTVVFSGMMKFIVFSPYWNVPKSIVEKEIEPGLVEDPNYLENHDMERNGDEIRQKPGPKNSLGLVKFLFPNNNNIYLHDTPAKSLFNKQDRAFSHGCIRLEKPRDLAIEILKRDKTWTPEKIDEAMNAGDEKWVTLKKRIPVYIGYFTAWVDNKGAVHFYEDIYNRDNRLAAMVYDN